MHHEPTPALRVLSTLRAFHTRELHTHECIQVALCNRDGLRPRGPNRTGYLVPLRLPNWDRIFCPNQGEVQHNSSGYWALARGRTARKYRYKKLQAAPGLLLGAAALAHRMRNFQSGHARTRRRRRPPGLSPPTRPRQLTKAPLRMFNALRSDLCFPVGPPTAVDPRPARADKVALTGRALV